MKTKLIERGDNVWCVHDSDNDDEHLAHLYYKGSHEWKLLHDTDNGSKVEEFEADGTVDAITWIDAFFSAARNHVACERKPYMPEALLEDYLGYQLANLKSLANVFRQPHIFTIAATTALANILSDVAEGERGKLLKTLHEGLDSAAADAAKQSSTPATPMGMPANIAQAFMEALKSGNVTVVPIGILRPGDEDEETPSAGPKEPAKH